MIRRLLALILLLGATLPAWTAEPFVIVVHPSVSAPRLSVATWSAVFLKKARRWPDGTSIVPTDQPESAPLRVAFNAAVHRKSIAAVRSYWHQQIFSGREIPPQELPNDAAVIAFVRATPGAVGYVSASAATQGLTRIELGDHTQR